MQNQHEHTVKAKSYTFAIRTIKLYQYLSEQKKEFVLSKQLLRSGTAIGASIREAEHGESKADFIHKMAIAQKEANETEYWLDLLFETQYLDKTQYDSITVDCAEIRKMLAAIIISSKKSISPKSVS